MAAEADSRRRRWVLAAAGAILVAVHWAIILHRRAAGPGDFDVLREFGQRFLAGEPLYRAGVPYPYMPAAAMTFAPLALLPPTLGLALRYAAALLCLWLLSRLLGDMASQHFDVPPQRLALLAALPLLLASHYLIRDLDDGGLHIFLLAIAVAGVAALRRGRTALAAAALGFAIATKATYALLLPYLFWKRRWRAGLLTTAAAASWIAAPALWMGAGAWWSHQIQWTQTALASLRGAPTVVARANETRRQNQALLPVLKRLASAAPDGSQDTGAAPPAEGHLPELALLALLAASAVWLRPRGAAVDQQLLPLESAAVLLLTVLLSPITWVQHLVVVLPALALLVADALGTARPRSRWVALLPFALLALVLNREVLGRARYVALLGYGLHTWAVLWLLALLGAAARRGRAR
jgi:alpha-1,2-mannosyltransferase